MTNKNVAVEWAKYMLKHNKQPKLFKGTNFAGKDNYLVSYSKPICQYMGMGIFRVSTKKYSTNTKRHQYYTNLALMDLQQDNPQIVIERVNEIEGEIFI